MPVLVCLTYGDKLYAECMEKDGSHPDPQKIKLKIAEETEVSMCIQFWHVVTHIERGVRAFYIMSRHWPTNLCSIILLYGRPQGFMRDFLLGGWGDFLSINYFVNMKFATRFGGGYPSPPSP